MISSSEFDFAAKGHRPCYDLGWYAVDRHGHIALLTSAGFDVIPSLVFRSHDGYLAAVRCFEGLPKRCQYTLHANERGDLSSWIDAACSGLFGYDFFPDRGQYALGDPYELITTPDRPLVLHELPSAVAYWLIPIRFSISFADSPQLFPEREFSEVNL